MRILLNVTEGKKVCCCFRNQLRERKKSKGKEEKMSVTGNVTNLNSLLDKMGDWDKDERYMATNDLCNELSKDIKIDENMEKRICASVLKQLGKWRESSNRPVFYSATP